MAQHPIAADRTYANPARSSGHTLPGCVPTRRYRHNVAGIILGVGEQRRVVVDERERRGPLPRGRCRYRYLA